MLIIIEHDEVVYKHYTMAKWNILKKKDSDLISANVKPWVDIFWVTWWYWGLEWLNKFVVWLAYSSNDNENAQDYAAFNSIRFYDEWLKIICMWCVTAHSVTFWRMFYYFEITKSTLSISNYKNYWTPWIPPMGHNDSWTYMYIQNIWWTNRYCFYCDDSQSPQWSWVSVYFNWTNLVEWWSWWTPIWVSRYDLKDSWAYNISQLSLLKVWNQTFFWESGVIAMWQTFTTIWWWDVSMIRAYMKSNWWTYSQPMICKIYNNTFTTLLWTSTNQYSITDSSYQEMEFRFSWVTLSAATQYWFLLTSPTWWNSWTWRTRIAFDYDLYSWWKMYIGWVVQDWLDLYFDIIIWGYRWNFTWSVESNLSIWSYACFWNATWFLNFN